MTGSRSIAAETFHVFWGGGLKIMPPVSLRIGPDTPPLGILSNVVLQLVALKLQAPQCHLGRLGFGQGMAQDIPKAPDPPHVGKNPSQIFIVSGRGWSKSKSFATQRLPESSRAYAGSGKVPKLVPVINELAGGVGSERGRNQFFQCIPHPRFDPAGGGALLGSHIMASIHIDETHDLLELRNGHSKIQEVHGTATEDLIKRSPFLQALFRSSK
jgi:hypothetical protein